MKYICEHCRNKVTDSQNFCHECGSQLIKISDESGISRRLSGVYEDEDEVYQSIQELLEGISKIEHFFADNYVKPLMRLVDENVIDDRLLDRANEVYNDFQVLKNWAKRK
mgnify:CR=1 FL=1